MTSTNLQTGVHGSEVAVRSEPPQREILNRIGTALPKLGAMSAWFGIGEFVGLCLTSFVPRISLKASVLGHAIGGLLLGLEWLGVMPHRRNTKRCLLHANDLFFSGMITDVEWEEMRAECLIRHRRRR